MKSEFCGLYKNDQKFYPMFFGVWQMAKNKVSKVYQWYRYQFPSSVAVEHYNILLDSIYLSLTLGASSGLSFAILQTIICSFWKGESDTFWRYLGLDGRWHQWIEVGEASLFLYKKKWEKFPIRPSPLPDNSEFFEFQNYLKNALPLSDQIQPFLNLRTYWWRKTPSDRQLKWHIYVSGH